MIPVDNKELWRQIPPEEKLQQMARAHMSGAQASLVTILVASTLAVGFHSSWLMWASIIVSPMIFQISAGRAWRALKPNMMLRYLAARSAARRYAFGASARQLDLKLIFRGTLTEEFELVQDELEAAVENNQETEVWIAMFADALVVMSEDIGGAKLQFAHLIDDKLKVSSDPELGDYINDKEVFLTSEDRQWAGRNFKLTSQYPAALIVLEKSLLQRIEEHKIAEERRMAALSVDGDLEDYYDDYDETSFDDMDDMD